MPQLLHCADLHLSHDERDYGQAVLDEILSHARDCDALLLCGDTFDSYTDMHTLQPDVVKSIEQQLPLHCRVLLLPGNHEYLYGPPGTAPAKTSPFSGLDWGRIELLDRMPFAYAEIGTGSSRGDIVAIPHSEQYSQYSAWDIPNRCGAWRIVMAHAAVAGLHYLGPDEEEDGGVLDPDLFRHCQADYAAMGHIHRTASATIAGTHICFPGSARVWRKHESGARQVLRLTVSAGGVQPQTVQLRSAGQFIETPVAVNPDGSCRLPPDVNYSPNDWIHCILTGICENDDSLQNGIRSLKAAITARKCTINRDEVTIIQGIRNNAFAQRFEQLWQKRAATAADREDIATGFVHSERETLYRARLIGLREIYRLLQEQA